MNDQIVSYLEKLRFIQPADIGGKACNLYKLFAMGLIVPPWIVVKTDVFRQFIAPLKQEIDGYFGLFKDDDPGPLQRRYRKLKKAILQIPFDQKLEAELYEQIETVLPGRRLFAVRSSAVGEDSGIHSYAGLFESQLNVPAAELPAAIKSVWISSLSPRVFLYRKRTGQKMNVMPVGVIIQVMVQPEVSGILFSRDPETEEKECLIEAAYGLGEGVVSNRVANDTIRIAWSGKRLEERIASKKYRLVLKRENGSGVTRDMVPLHKQSRPALSPTRVRKLKKLARKLEIKFGSPQDIEWAFVRTGDLYVLQSRPIVFRRPPERKIWDNSNIVESYPGMTLPLTFSFVRRGYEISFKKAVRTLIPYKRYFQTYEHIFRHMIGILKGRIYYNLLNWYHVISLMPGFKNRRQAWDQMIGISFRTSFRPPLLPPFYRLVFYLKFGKRLIYPRNTLEKFVALFIPFLKKLQSQDFSRMSAHQIKEAYQGILNEGDRVWHLTLFNDLYAMTYYDWLKKLCCRWLKEDTQNIYNDLLSHTNSVESVKPMQSLQQIIKMINADIKYRHLFNLRNDREIWMKIENSPVYEKLHLTLTEHLDLYGERRLEELKLENPLLKEQPEMLIALCRGMLDHKPVEAHPMARREQAENAISRQLKNPFKALLLRFILNRARYTIAAREQMRLTRARLFGVIRRMFLRMADLFTQSGILHSRDDIFYLTVDEIFDYIESGVPAANLKALVDLRKEVYAGDQSVRLPERIETSEIPDFDHLGLPGPYSDRQGILQGIGCSSGIIRGNVKIVERPVLGMETAGQILVTHSTDPGWLYLMMQCRGMVVEKGSVLSHTAIVGRELGIPTIVGAKSATRILADNMEIEMNGGTGEITWN